MLERLLGLKKVEHSSSASLQVVKEVANLIRNNVNSVLLTDLSDYPLPRIELTIHAKSGFKNLGIRVMRELNEENMEVLIYDSNLKPFTPPDNSFCNRVNVFGGETANSYSTSVGYSFAEAIFEKMESDGSKLIISDNWTETTLTAQETLNLLGNARGFNMPRYSPYEKTESGKPRHTPLT